MTIYRISNAFVVHLHCTWLIRFSVFRRSRCVILHFLVNVPIQINVDGLRPFGDVLQTELDALFNADDVTAQTFGQGKCVLRECELVKRAMILARIHLVKVHAQRSGKVAKTNCNVRHFIFQGVLD